MSTEYIEVPSPFDVSDQALRKLAPHYPDLVEAGSLGRLIGSKLLEADSPLRMTLHTLDGSPMLPLAYATIDDKNREAGFYVSKDKRMFLFDFRENGVALVSGNTSDLSRLVSLTMAWFDGVKATQFSKDHSEAVLSGMPPGAESYENGTYVEDSWQFNLKHAQDFYTGLVPLIEEILKVPELRRLMPFVSMGVLNFSRCIGFPFTRDCPKVHEEKVGADIRYVVLGPKNNYLGDGTALEAVCLLIDNLPRGCGAAIYGTAEDLETKSVDAQSHDAV